MENGQNKQCNSNRKKYQNRTKEKPSVTTDIFSSLHLSVYILTRTTGWVHNTFIEKKTTKTQKKQGKMAFKKNGIDAYSWRLQDGKETPQKTGK